MSTLFTLFILLGIFCLTIVIAGLFLPTAWTIDKAELVPNTAAKLFPLLNTLKEWETWTVWSTDDKEKSLTLSYEGPTAGVGALQHWDSQRLNGTLRITKSIPNEQVEYEFDIAEGALSIKGTLVLAAADTHYTQVAWRCELQTLTDQNPIRRYQALLLKNYFDSNMEASLSALAAMFETEED